MPFDAMPSDHPAPVITDPVAKVLWDAAKYIRERGLAKGIAEEKDGRLCIGGAMSKAACGNPWTWRDDPIFIEAVDAMEEYLKFPRGFPSMWNNDECRTSSEVIHALESCARELQARGRG